MKLTSIILDGSRLVHDEGSDRAAILRAICCANRNIEMHGKELELLLELKNEDNGERYCVNLLVDRIMELDELINRHTMCPALHDWMENTLKVYERPNEQQRLEGMSWVHMGIRAEDRLLGWVTACVMPSDKYSKALKISFAFCMPKDCFSKRLGRILSRTRMDEGKHYTVVKGDDRWESVKYLIDGIVAGKKVATVIRDEWGTVFPGWLGVNQRIRKDIPADIHKFLEKISEDTDIDPLRRREALALLGHDMEFVGTLWQVRDS